MASGVYLVRLSVDEGQFTVDSGWQHSVESGTGKVGGYFIVG